MANKTLKKYLSYDQLNATQRKLLDEAERNMGKSYAPYSNFHVGAAIMAKDGSVYPGMNIENANYTNTQHGETTAIANVYGAGKRELVMLAIIARGEGFDTETPTPPCGYCRQTLYEAAQVSGNDIQLVLSNTKKTKILLTTVNEILSGAFGPSDLGIDVSKYRTLKRAVTP